MVGFLILLLPFVFVFVASIRGMHPALAWVLSWTVIPTLVLLDEFILPYAGGGASFFPLTLILGGFYGVISGGGGAISAALFLKTKSGRRDT